MSPSTPLARSPLSITWDLRGLLSSRTITEPAIKKQINPTVNVTTSRIRTPLAAAEPDAGEGYHKQQKPDHGQNNTHIRMLPESVARFTRRGPFANRPYARECRDREGRVVHERSLPDAIAQR